MRRSIPCAALALLLGCVLPAPAAAQQLAPGTRLRVTAADGRTIGLVEHSTADSLVLSLPDGGRAAFPWGGVVRVEQSAGTRSRAGRGALIGAGAMTALTLGAIVFGGSEDELEDDIGDTVLILALPLNAAIGAGVGALVGTAWRTERWTVLPLAGTRAGVNGPGIVVTLRF